MLNLGYLMSEAYKPISAKYDLDYVSYVEEFKLFLKDALYLMGYKNLSKRCDDLELVNEFLTIQSSIESHKTSLFEVLGLYIEDWVDSGLTASGYYEAGVQRRKEYDERLESLLYSIYTEEEFLTLKEVSNNRNNFEGHHLWNSTLKANHGYKNSKFYNPNNVGKLFLNIDLVAASAQAMMFLFNKGGAVRGDSVNKLFDLLGVTHPLDRQSKFVRANIGSRLEIYGVHLGKLLMSIESNLILDVLALLQGNLLLKTGVQKTHDEVIFEIGYDKYDEVVGFLSNIVFPCTVTVEVFEMFKLSSNSKAVIVEVTDVFSLSKSRKLKAFSVLQTKEVLLGLAEMGILV